MFIKNTYYIDDKFDFMCDEYSNALVASWMGKAYDMMFAEALLIDWSEEEDCLLRKVIDCKEWNMYECLKNYHGITVSDKINIGEIGGRREFANFVRQEIDKNVPVWVDFLMKEVSCLSETDKAWGEGNNMAIIVGISEEEEKLYFRVMHFRDKYLDLLSMSFEEAERSILTVRKYNYMPIEQKDINLDKFLADIAEKVTELNIYEKFDKFLRYFDKEITYEHIFKEIEQSGLKYLPFVYNLSVLYRSRVLFSFCLSYLAVLHGNPVLQEMADEMAVNGGKFYNIRGIILKINYHQKLKQTDKDKIIGYLHRIIESEKQLLKKMRGFTISEYNQVKEYQLDDEKSNRPIFCVDLVMKFNNLALSAVLSRTSKSNFDGMGGYFLNEKYPYGQMLSVEDMKFLIADKNDDGDNISCQGQTIEVDPGNYSSLMILASSCHGSFKDYMTLIYEGCDSERMLIVSSSFWYPKAHFAETTAWQGRYVMLTDDDYYIEQRELNIYAKVYGINRLKTLKAVILPDCPDIHIFAISLR